MPIEVSTFGHRASQGTVLSQDMSPVGTVWDTQQDVDITDPGGRGCSSPSGHGVLRTVHFRVSLVSVQVVRSPPGAWSTLRVRSSEPFRKPHSFLFLEQGPHGDHSLISHCAEGGELGGREGRGKGAAPSPLWSV